MSPVSLRISFQKDEALAWKTPWFVNARDPQGCLAPEETLFTFWKVRLRTQDPFYPICKLQFFLLAGVGELHHGISIFEMRYTMIPSEYLLQFIIQALKFQCVGNWSGFLFCHRRGINQCVGNHGVIICFLVE